MMYYGKKKDCIQIKKLLFASSFVMQIIQEPDLINLFTTLHHNKKYFEQSI